MTNNHSQPQRARPAPLNTRRYQEYTADPGVSRDALSIAREIDRLPAGEYALTIEKKPRADGGGITCGTFAKVRHSEYNSTSKAGE